VLAVAAHCPLFRDLEVTHGLRLSDDTLLALVSGCSHLIAVYTLDTVEVTEAGLLALADQRPACLVLLRLCSSDTISVATRERLRACCPKLRLNLTNESVRWFSA
jgi:hypothetical protein